MCGEFSEDADVPCGMQLYCSATGWCGVSQRSPIFIDPLSPLSRLMTKCCADYRGILPQCRSDTQHSAMPGRIRFMFDFKGAFLWCLWFFFWTHHRVLPVVEDAQKKV
jgi:hypothetical protein